MRNVRHHKRLSCCCLQVLFERGEVVPGFPTAPVMARYRCFLPDLAGLAGSRRVGPGTKISLPEAGPGTHQACGLTMEWLPVTLTPTRREGRYSLKKA